MIIGIDRNEIKEFISTSDNESEVPTKFLIGNMLEEQKMSLIGTVITYDGSVDKKELFSRANDIFKMGIKGIKNLYSPIKKISIDITEISDEILEMVPMQTRFEVVGAIMTYNFETRGIRKN